MNQEKVWDEIGKSWKEFRTKIPPTVEDFLSGRTGKILDVGCGSGRNFIKMDDVEWYGVDFSKEMLKYAEDVSKSKGIDAHLSRASVEKIPYDDDFFDAVLFYAVLHCVDSEDKRRKSLEEIYRVLKTGGEALVSSWGLKSPRLRNKEKECFVSWTARGGEGSIERYTYVYDFEELKDLLEDVGFEIIKSWEERNVNFIVRKKVQKFR
jgi:ubiquinone/menaquinone biosynthesis C-methylase UbiE